MTGNRSWVLALLALAASGLGRAQTATRFAISGTVLSMDGSAIAGAHLAATSDRPCSEPGRAEAAETDGQGHFQLWVPCPGVWRLSAEARGFPTQAYQQHGAFSTGVVLTPSHAEHEIAFRMVAGSSVSGTVLDEVGDPVRDAKVFLLIPETSGGDLLRAVDQATTDDRGLYEFTGVSPADYEVAVQVQPWYAVVEPASRTTANGNLPGAGGADLDPSLDVTYPITYYPAATDASAASTVSVLGGTNQEADIRLSPVPSVHVIVPGGGRPNPGFGGGRPMHRGTGSSPSIQELSAFGALKFDPTSVTVLPDGSLDVGGFSAGDFSVANGRSRDGASQQQFTVAKDAGRTITLGMGVTRLAPKQQATGTLSGVAVLGQNPCEGALVLLVPLAAADGHARRQQSNTDGSFSFERVPLGKYILVAVDQGWGIDLQDAQTVNGYLAHGVPVEFKGSMNLKTAVQAMPR